MKLTYIIVDPNAIQRLHLIQIFKKVEALSKKAEFSNAVDALNFLKYNSIDLIFLASKLPVYSGFDFIAKLCDPNQVIFLTEKAEDALKAFELGLTDCIAPPYSLERIEKAVLRAQINLQSKRVLQPNNEKIIEVKHNLKIEKIASSKIKWIEAMGDYIKIITQEKNYLVLSTMKAFIKKLPENQFLRIHKSFIVNLNRVANYSANSVNIDGIDLPLSRNKKKDFRQTITQH
ncbi:MAG: LytR/AlgR family response regulator transcription factor [Flavobacteriaceae bacterium]